MCKSKKCSAIFFLTLLILKSNLFLVRNACADFTPVHEYELKAVFLYNLGHFISYPPQSINSGYFSICVLGKTPFQGSLELATSGKQLHGQPVKLRYLKRLEESLDCQIVFISQSEEPTLSNILSIFEKYPILTVSDIPDFLSEGGMIKFVIQDSKVRLQINQTNLNKTGLNASAKLLTLADIFK